MFVGWKEYRRLMLDFNNPFCGGGHPRQRAIPVARFASVGVMENLRSCRSLLGAVGNDQRCRFSIPGSSLKIRANPLIDSYDGLITRDVRAAVRFDYVPCWPRSKLVTLYIFSVIPL